MERIEANFEPTELPDQQIGGGQVQGEGDVLQGADANEGLDIGVVRGLFPGVHQKNHALHLAGCDAGGDLEISAGGAR